jgi:chemotaxis protein methyltransferase CheR
VSAEPAARHDDFLQFCAGVRRLTGIDLTQYKRRQMERRVRTFADRRAPDLAGYLQLLSVDRDELNDFLDRVTINVSQLWRNPEQWQALAKIVAELAETGTLRAWSAGCSYGAEAYTLACLIAESMPGQRFEITGSDIDRRIVERAQRGRFSQADMRHVPPSVRAKYFKPDGDGWLATDALRKHLRFRVEDLLHARYPSGLDLVLCRNVVIYFNDAARNHVHSGIAGALRKGGYFMVGATERVGDPAGMGLQTAYPFIYRKAG